MSASTSDCLPVLITGAAGFLGKALVRELVQAGLSVRAFDVVSWADAAVSGVEVAVGDAGDPSAVERACAGCGAMVIAHMAPNRPEIYATAEVPFDVNVKGCALLFEAAVRQGMRRVVLISSIAVVEGHRADGVMLHAELPARPTSLYGLTKTLQEQIALYHHRQSGLPVAVLRPAYVTDADTLTDKYGRKKPSVNWQCVDRRDVAGAAVAALRVPGLAFGTYFVPGHPEAGRHMETSSIQRDLGWTPAHDFSQWPPDAA